MDTETAALIVAAAGSAISAYSASRSSNANREMTAEERAQQELQDRRATAAREAMLNPFRQQGQQINSVMALDRIQNSRYTPVKLTPAPSYASSVPKMSGGTSYQRSDAVRNAAGAAKTSVLAGKTAPTMTDPANYGRTAALTLDENGNPTTDTSTTGGAGGAGAVPGFGVGGPASQLLPSYTQRGGGTGTGMVRGVAGGAAAGFARGGPWGAAAGAVIGGVTSAVTRHAKTKPTDYTVADASDAITRTIQYYQGRVATSQEIDEILRGQGWEPGDRWVGKDGLTSVLNVLAAGAGK